MRFSEGNWSGLWHAAPSGWCQMPGHGHQDCGSFELHYGNEPIFVDPGRGNYGLSKESIRYQSAEVHNGLMVDFYDPYPINRPYYNEKFKR